jgi:hypothetical protein
MPIPAFNEQGLLPDGIHDCSLEEAAARFGSFQGSDRRPALWNRLKHFIREAQSSGVVDFLLLDGSFVTAKPDPNDIDLVVIVRSDYDFRGEPTPDEYNLLSKFRVRRRFGFDIILARADAEDLDEAADFFRQVRDYPHIKKGILRISL